MQNSLKSHEAWSHFLLKKIYNISEFDSGYTNGYT